MTGNGKERSHSVKLPKHLHLRLQAGMRRQSDGKEGCLNSCKPKQKGKEGQTRSGKVMQLLTSRCR